MSISRGYKFKDTEQRRERFLKLVTKHGFRYMPEYCCWVMMKQRCNNPKNSSYQYYGGRGISVCQEWNDEFVAFYNDMGPRPKGFQIERKDTNLGYYKDNCFWASKTVNSRNKRNSKYWYIDGVRYESLGHASECLGVGTNIIKKWCDGRSDKVKGKFYIYPPKQNCWSEIKYE